MCLFRGVLEEAENVCFETLKGFFFRNYMTVFLEIY